MFNQISKVEDMAENEKNELLIEKKMESIQDFTTWQVEKRPEEESARYHPQNCLQKDSNYHHNK